MSKNKTDNPIPLSQMNKRQTLSSLRKIKNKLEINFRTPNQGLFYKTINKHDVTFCMGPAGSGKTYITVYYALEQLANKSNKYDGIIITKPLVEANGEKVGFLPGDIKEKTDPFMMSFYYNIEQIINKQLMEKLVDHEIIKVIPMAYMRGLTLANKIVILDEAQNAMPEQIKMFLTRMGENSKFIITGDLQQTDIKKDGNGLYDSIKRFNNILGVGLAKFEKTDIVRHPLIGKLLAEYDMEKLTKKRPNTIINEWVKNQEEEIIL